MKIFKIFLFLILSISTTLFAEEPPYHGTIFIEPNLITSADPSAFDSISPIGKQDKTVFDRRVNDWTTLNAFFIPIVKSNYPFTFYRFNWDIHLVKNNEKLFLTVSIYKVIWKDGLSSIAVVNPEFTEAQAKSEAKKYGILIGQLPYILRKEVKEIWIHKGVELFGGGNHSILIHTGQSSIYEKEGIIEETLIHEAVHTSLDEEFSKSSDWIKAQKSDGNFIYNYAKENPDREDLAESFLLWLALRYKTSKISAENQKIINKTIPSRLKFFDSKKFLISPITKSK
jgi:hypothetical protein